MGTPDLAPDHSQFGIPLRNLVLAGLLCSVDVGDPLAKIELSIGLGRYTWEWESVG